MLNVGSTVGSFDKHALETEITQLKDALTSVRIKIDGYKAENVNLKRRYKELSKSNAYSRSTFTTKINALTADNAKLKTELSGKMSSGFTASEKPKVLASGMYTNSSKTKPATESRKPMPKSHTRNHRILPSKSVNARRATKLRALTSENTKLKALVHGKTSSGPSASEKPKVLASGMYTNSSKYVPPPKRANWVKPTPLPKKKQVTFHEPPRTSNRPTQKPPVQQNKKPNVSVNLSTRTKPATAS
ncbi:hypothetical protein Tco_1574767, partial [Tanacetum coccineum]